MKPLIGNPPPIPQYNGLALKIGVNTDWLAEWLGDTLIPAAKVVVVGGALLWGLVVGIVWAERWFK